MTVRPLGEVAEQSNVPASPVHDAAVPHQALWGLLWSQSRAARLLRRITVSLAFLFGLAMLRIPVESVGLPQAFRKDFHQEYLLARAIAEGTDPYLPIPVLAERFLGPVPGSLMEHPTPHPPTAGLLFLPLASLDYPSAAIVWTILEAVCVIVAVRLLGRIAGVRLGRRATLVVAVISLAWFPLVIEIVYGQLMLPILVLLAGTSCALSSSRRVASGVLIGLSMLLKPIAWPILLMFMVRREWRALAAGLSTVLLGYLAAAWVIGIAPVYVYLTQVLPSVGAHYQVAYGNVSAWTFSWRFFGGTSSMSHIGTNASPLVQSSWIGSAISAAFPALILLASLITIRRKRSLSRSLGLMVCVSILVSPISWNHHLVLATVPAAEVGGWLVRHHLPSRETNVALLVAILLLPGLDWTQLALAAAGQHPPPSGPLQIPYPAALLTLEPTIAVAGLALQLVALPDLPRPRVKLGVAEGEFVKGERT